MRPNFGNYDRSKIMVIHLLKRKGQYGSLLCTNAFIKGATTTDVKKVTCQNCIKIMKRKKMI